MDGPRLAFCSQGSPARNERRLKRRMDNVGGRAADRAVVPAMNAALSGE